MKKNDGILSTNTVWTLDGFNKNKTRVKIGDSVKLPTFTVPETEISGKKTILFKKLKISDKAFVVGKDSNGDFILAFDHCLFQSVIDYNGEKDFEKTQLSQYLTGAFLQAMQAAGISAKECSLFSYDEMFGEKRLDYFRKARNRIASSFDEDLNHWYWLSMPYKASASDFCFVSGNGCADCGIAGYAYRYVRPRFVLTA